MLLWNFLSYTLGSLGLAVFILLKAFYQYHQFYPAMVYIYQSKACNLILVNFFVMLTFVFFKLSKTVLLGSIRDSEVESLQEKLWFSISDTLLAMTVFQDDFNLSFFVWFASLIVVKVFHWLLAERIDFMTRSITEGMVSYLRIVFLVLVLSFVDFMMVNYTVKKALSDTPSMMLLFAFEYVILSVTIVSLVVKFGMNCYDLYANNPWENKGVVCMYLDLIVDLVQMLVYVAFFVSIMRHYGLPLHLIRQIYFTFNSLWKRINSVRKYRTLTRDLETRFPVATPEQLAEERDDVCIVCREPMESGRVLPCGHILHRKCLLSWLERSQFCPLCREPVGGDEEQQQQQQQQLPFQPFPDFAQNPMMFQPNFPVHPQHQPIPPVVPQHVDPSFPPPSSPPSPSPFSPSPVATGHGFNSSNDAIEKIQTQLILLQEQVLFMNEQIVVLLGDLHRLRSQPNEPSPLNEMVPPLQDSLTEPFMTATTSTTTTTSTTSTSTSTQPTPTSTQPITTSTTPPTTLTTSTPLKPSYTTEAQYKNETNEALGDDEQLMDSKEELRKRRVLHFSGERVIPNTQFQKS